MSKLFGMIHLPSLRNTDFDINEIINYAIDETKKLEDLGYDGIVIENFGDQPFSSIKVEDEIIVKLSIICHELRKVFSGSIGLNILRNATLQAMKIASILKLDFVRSNIWEGAYVTDQGIINGVAYDVMKTKRLMNSKVKIFADIFVKHATPLADFSVLEAAEHALGRGGADDIIISGRKSGGEIDYSMLDELNSSGIKPIIGSGLKLDSIPKYKGKISGAIVGSAIKEKDITSKIDMSKASEFIKKWRMEI